MGCLVCNEPGLGSAAYSHLLSVREGGEVIESSRVLRFYLICKAEVTPHFARRSHVLQHRGPMSMTLRGARHSSKDAEHDMVAF